MQEESDYLEVNFSILEEVKLPVKKNSLQAIRKS